MVMPEELEERRKRAKRRENMPEFFVVLLTAIAYQEMVNVVRDSVRSEGFTFATLALFTIFFLSAMRFFIGNQLHLQSESDANGYVWLFDLIVIVLQMTMIIFLGGLTSLDANSASPVGFFWLLIILYGIDVAWIFLQYALDKAFAYWKRNSIPWQWGVLNSGLIVMMLLIYCLAGGFYSTAALVFLVIINAIAFAIDVLIVDSYGLL